jgi:hypothetical protein
MDTPSFFEDLDGPLISTEGPRPRVVMPGPAYPGNREWWKSGFTSYAMGHPMRNGGRPMEEAESWMHGYLTARMADLMGAEVPDELPDVSDGPSPLAPREGYGESDREWVRRERSSTITLEDMWSRRA